jgi:putative ABC transport system permease protein
MLLNYLKIAWRNLLRNKAYSTINLVGLATGMCVCFLAVHYVHFELSYDNYHQKADRIYRLVTDVKTASGTEYKSTTGAMASAIQNAFPEIEATARIFPDYLIIQKDQETYGEEKIAYADSALFSVFTIPLISGNPATVLNAPLTLVLSQTAARKYFGEENPIGKTLIFNGKDQATVTGIMKDMPANSHFRTDIFVSMKTLGPDWQTNWKRFFFYTYLVLPEQTDVTKLGSKITELVKLHTDQSQSQFSLSLERLKSVYLEGKARGTRGGTSLSGSWANVYIFSVISLVVLFIACFNFVNLTTAYSMRRMKEIGVRKVLGGERKQLIIQFLVDAILLSMFASFVAALMCILLRPVFDEFTGKHIAPDTFDFYKSLVLFVPAGLIIGFVAGIYPAFFLSGMLPINGLKGRFVSGLQGITLRKALVVAQFSVSITLILATIVVYTQLNFMKNYEPGFKKDHRLVVDFQFDGRVPEHNRVIKQRFSMLAEGAQVSMSSCIPGKENHTFPTRIENKDEDFQEILAEAYFIDHDFLKQYGIEMVAGRAFSENRATDSTEAIIINEAAVRTLGFADPEVALGKKFEQLNRKGVIIGVAKDFHFHSFMEKVRPLTFRIAPGFFTYLSINIPTENTGVHLENLKRKWNEIIPGMPFVYSFADDAYHAQYVAEEKFGRLFISFSGLAIFLSCLGLVGLSALSITQRTKEIGVRKMLGASVREVFNLLTADFLKLVFLALVVSVPVSWYLMEKWLHEFAYRIDLAFWMFGAAGALVLLTALATISFQTVQAALMNPVRSLKMD